MKKDWKYRLLVAVWVAALLNAGYVTHGVLIRLGYVTAPVPYGWTDKWAEIIHPKDAAGNQYTCRTEGNITVCDVPETDSEPMDKNLKVGAWVTLPLSREIVLAEPAITESKDTEGFGPGNWFNLPRFDGKVAKRGPDDLGMSSVCTPGTWSADEGCRGLLPKEPAIIEIGTVNAAWLRPRSAFWRPCGKKPFAGAWGCYSEGIQ